MTRIPRSLLVAAAVIVTAVVLQTCVAFVRVWTPFLSPSNASDAAQFENALDNRDIPRAERLLAANPSLLEARDEYNRTPLYRTVATPLQGHGRIAAWLVSKGADVNAQDHNGFSPLFWAAFNGERDLVELLVAHGANVNITTRKGKTPLDAAAAKEFTDVVLFLAEHGADVNAAPPGEGDPQRTLPPAVPAPHTGKSAETERRAADQAGLTPLHLAARAGQPARLSTLIDRGADVNARVQARRFPTPMGTLGVGGETPLHLAAASGSVECVRLLLARGADLRVTDARGWTPLLHAVNSGRDGCVRVLLEAGAPIGPQGGGEALHAACYRGCPGIVRMLLDRGADIHARNPQTRDTGLHRAIAFPEGRFPEARPDGSGMTPGHVAVVALLLERGADPLARSGLGVTPLHDAASQGYAEAVGLMLDRRADPNVRDDSKSTPLHGAAMAGQLAAARLLLDRGAIVNAWSDHNQPLHLAVRFAHREVAALLLARGADVQARTKGGKSALDEALARHEWPPAMTSILELLIRAGADIRKSADGTPPLLRASREGAVPALDLLLKHGADINARDAYGRTALHWTAEDERLDMVELLVSKGADVNALDAQRRTPMYYADGSGMGARIKAFLRQHGGIGAFGEPRQP